TLIVLLPLTQARSVENCQRSFFSYPKRGHPYVPSELYGMLPAKLISGGPASWATMPLLAPEPHRIAGHPAPAAREFRPMYHRSQATTEWLIRLLLMIQSHWVWACVV